MPDGTNTLKAARLALVCLDADWSLVSLADRVVLSDGTDQTWFDKSILRIEIHEGNEREIAARAGREYTGGCPAWTEVFDYIEAEKLGRPAPDGPNQETE